MTKRTKQASNAKERPAAASAGGAPELSGVKPGTAAGWGVDTCARCGATLALGDETYRTRLRGRLVVVCARCASECCVEPDRS